VVRDARARRLLEPASLGARLVGAIAGRDTPALAACFTDDVAFRALIPPGLRERTGAAETAALIAGWFADSAELDLVDSHADEVEDKLHLSYRFTGVEDGQPYLVEQHIYCTLNGGRIDRADLLCSGFRSRRAQ
jgi:hypothetical protein